MIKTLIIEDEETAAKRLGKLLTEIEPDIDIIEVLDSVDTSIKWLNNHPEPDLIMLDIQLADGISFEIFKQVQIKSSVIFTTAYDEYAIKAFELNSIDYLLKPIQKDQLEKSIQKLRSFRFDPLKSINYKELIELVENRKNRFKQRFLVNAGNRLKSVLIEDIAYFYSMDKSTFLCTYSGKIYPLDNSLDKLELLLDPEIFFRINRKYIIAMSAIQNMYLYSKSRIKIDLCPDPDGQDEVIVSSNRSSEFRKWLDR